MLFWVVTLYNSEKISHFRGTYIFKVGKRSKKLAEVGSKVPSTSEDFLLGLLGSQLSRNRINWNKCYSSEYIQLFLLSGKYEGVLHISKLTGI
jgi:hypothetical protein